MTVSAATPSITYAANGVATVYAYPFKTFIASHLVATLDGLTVTNYTVSGLGSDGGGNLTFSPAPLGELVIRRVLPLSRSADYQAGGAFREDQVDQDQDIQTQQIQQIAEESGRSLKLAPGSSTPANLVPTPNTFPAFDAVGNLINAILQTGTSLVDLAASAGAALIGFIQDGIGAISRTVQDKLRERISVLDFIPESEHAGIISGSLSYDCATAIQNCINEANGRIVYMPYGFYLIEAFTPELNNQTNVAVVNAAAKLVGDGIGRTVLINRTGSKALKHTSTLAQATARSLAYNGSISHLSIRIDGSSPAGSAGISLESFWFSKICDIEISGVRGNGIETLVNPGLGANSDLYACGCLTIKRVDVSGCDGVGIYSDSPSNTFDIANCYVANNKSGGVIIAGASHKIYGGAIVGNGVTTGGGLSVIYSESSPHNVHVSGVEFDNNYNHHAYIDGYHCTLSKNRFIQSGLGGSYRAATCVKLDGTTSGYPQEHTVSDNLFRFDSPGPAITAISITDTVHGTGNFFRNNLFSTSIGVTKYNFPVARARNVAVENGRVVENKSFTVITQNPVAVAYVGSTVTLTSTPQKLNLNSVVVDSNAAFDTANKRFICPCSGVLTVTHNGFYQPITTANIAANIYVYVNGSAKHTQSLARAFSTIGTPESYSFSVDFTVTSGDQIEIWASVATSSTLANTSSVTATTKFEIQ